MSFLPSKKQLLLIFSIFIIWRVMLFVLSMYAQTSLPYTPSFPYAEAILLNRGLPQWLASWANFDGVHYLTIVEKGYLGTGLIQAFFPFFPGLIFSLTLFNIDPLPAGLIISNLSFFALLLAFFQYFSLKKTVRPLLFILILLSFPTSFFFGALYTESLFMLLVFTSLWAAEDKKWVLAGLLASLASATRLVGGFLVLALLVEFFQQQNFSIKKLFTDAKKVFQVSLTHLNKKRSIVLSLVIAPLGLVSYMVYLAVQFQDPLYFYHVQSEFGGGRQESLILLPQVIWRYIKIFITYRPFDFKYLMFVQEFFFTAAAYITLFLTRKKVRWSWITFAFLAITLPTLTGTLSSMARYVLVSLPIFVYLALVLETARWKQVAWISLSGCILVFNVVLFIQGYWVA